MAQQELPFIDFENLHAGELHANLFLRPDARKDRGAIHYTSLKEAVKSWREDPHGQKKFAFLSDAYGIPREKINPFLKASGMSEYVRAKKEGRLVGMIATQILNPTYYFMTNALALAKLHKKGIPTSLMVLEYPHDTYYSENPDKRAVFDVLKFPVGTKEGPDGQQIVQTVQMQLEPAGILKDDGTAFPIGRIQQANGYRCDQVLIKVGYAMDPFGKKYPTDEKQSGPKWDKASRQATKAALGIDIPEGYVRLTDFYKVLFKAAIANLRNEGILPSEKDMPLFFVDMSNMYTQLGKVANPSPRLKEALGYVSNRHLLATIIRPDERIAQHLIQEGSEEEIARYLLDAHKLEIKNGLATHPDGMLDAGAYYPIQTAWPDTYFECSSCGGDIFVGKLRRAQQLKHSYGIEESEIRLPDAEVPQMEQFSVHPGRYNDFAAEHEELGRNTRATAEEITNIQAQAKEGRRDKVTTKDTLKKLYERNARFRAEHTKELVQKIAHAENVKQSTFVIPHAIRRVYDALLGGAL